MPAASHTGPDCCPNPGLGAPHAGPLPTGRRPQHTGHTQAASLIPGHEQSSLARSRIYSTFLGCPVTESLREQRVSGLGHSPMASYAAHTEAPSGPPCCSPGSRRRPAACSEVATPAPACGAWAVAETPPSVYRGGWFTCRCPWAASTPTPVKVSLIPGSLVSICQTPSGSRCLFRSWCHTTCQSDTCAAQDGLGTLQPQRPPSARGSG